MYEVIKKGVQLADENPHSQLLDRTPIRYLKNTSQENNTTFLKDFQFLEDGEYRINENGEVKENNWKEKKEYSLILSDSYERIGELKKAERVKNCGTNLEFLECSNGHKRLVNAYFCKDRLCPMCSWRKSKAMSKQLHDILKAYVEGVDRIDLGSMERKQIKAPEGTRFLFLTLTQKNVTGENLKDEISHLMKGFDRLIKRRKLKKNLLGYFRALEVTRNLKPYSKSFNTYHPHFHVLLVVKGSYFSKNYITKTEWWEMWKKSLGLDYDPNIDIRVVTDKENKKAVTTDDIKEKSYSSAVFETAKYTVKGSDIVFKDENKRKFMDEGVQVLSDALARRRLLAFGGVLKDVKQLLGLEDVESSDYDLVGAEKHLDDCTCPICKEKMTHKIYQWNFGFNDYTLIGERD